MLTLGKKGRLTELATNPNIATLKIMAQTASAVCAPAHTIRARRSRFRSASAHPRASGTASNATAPWPPVGPST